MKEGTDDNYEGNPKVIHPIFQVCSGIIEQVPLPFLQSHLLSELQGCGMEYVNDEAVRRALEYACSLQEKILKDMESRSGNRPVPQAPVTKDLKPTTASANMAIFNRVHVSSIHFDLSDLDIASLFSQFGPVKSIQMTSEASSFQQIPTKHKGYGYVEYECPEGAELAVRADGQMEIAGRQVKIGRPANFPSELPPGVPKAPAGRIYISGVAKEVSEQDVKLLLEAIGPVKQLSLYPDHAQQTAVQHRGFGYAEFDRPSDAVTAVTILNGFELAGRRFSSTRAILGVPLEEGMSLLSKREEPRESLVIVLRNLGDPKLVASALEREELLQDCLAECRKFGQIESDQLVVTQDSISLYLQYTKRESAQAATSALNNRWFGGCQIAVEPYSSDLYLMRDFTSIK